MYTYTYTYIIRYIFIGKCIAIHIPIIRNIFRIISLTNHYFFGIVLLICMCPGVLLCMAKYWFVHGCVYV